MKLTVNQLRRIIKEEVSRVLKEDRNDTIGDALTKAGIDPTTSNLKKYLNVPVGGSFWSSFNKEYKFATHEDPGMDYIDVSKEEIAALRAALRGSSRATDEADAMLDVSGPEVEMMSGRSSFVIELGDSSKEAVRLFKRAAAWCAKVKGPIDYSAANSIEIGTEEDGVTVDFVPNPKQMAASFNAAADFIAQNSKKLIHVDID